MHNVKAKNIQTDSIESKDEEAISIKNHLRYDEDITPEDDYDLVPKWYVDQNSGGSAEGIVITESSPYVSALDSGGIITINDFLTAYPEIAASGITRLHIDVLIDGIWYPSDVLPDGPSLDKDENGHILSATYYLGQSGTITKLIARSTGGGTDSSGGGGGGGEATNLSIGTRTSTEVPILSSTGTDATLPVATTSLAGLQSAADKTKLDGIATGATANDTDANLKNRANHTGVLAATTITQDSTHRFVTDAEKATWNAAGTGLTNANFVDKEQPAGAINGSNVTYTLANTPVAGSEHLFVNGILQESGSGNDYTISGATITMLTVLLTGDKMRVSYRK